MRHCHNIKGVHPTGASLQWRRRRAACIVAAKREARQVQQRHVMSAIKVFVIGPLAFVASLILGVWLLCHR